LNDILLHSGEIRDQVAKLSEIRQNFDVIRPPKFFWGMAPKFLTDFFYKSGSTTNIVAKFGDDRLSALVAKMKKKDQNVSGKTKWPARLAQLPGGYNKALRGVCDYCLKSHDATFPLPSFFLPPLPPFFIFFPFPLPFPFLSFA